PGKADRGIEKKLDRIVSGLAVNLDEAGEIRRVAVVQPVVVGEPRIVPRERNQFAGTRMIEPERLLLLSIEDAIDTRKRRDDTAHLSDQLRPCHIDMRDLMIADRKRIRLA